MEDIQDLERTISFLEKNIAFNKMCGHKDAAKLEKAFLTYNKKKLRKLLKNDNQK